MALKNSDSNSYLKYAALTFQIFGVLAVGAYVGQWLDKKFNFQTPYLTIVLVFGLFAGIIYRIIVDTGKSSK